LKQFLLSLLRQHTVYVSKSALIRKVA